MSLPFNKVVEVFLGAMVKGPSVSVTGISETRFYANRGYIARMRGAEN